MKLRSPLDAVARSQDGKFGPLARLVRDSTKHHHRNYAIAIASMVTEALMTGASAYIIKDIINKVFIDKEFSAIFIVSSLILAIYVTKGISSYISSVTLNRIGNNVIARTQRAMFDAILAQDIAYFARHSVGDLVTRLGYNAQAARQALNLVVVSFGRDAVTIVVLIAVMLSQKPLIGLVALVILPLAVLGVARLIRTVRQVARTEIASMGKIVTHVQETAQGIRIVKAFGLEQRLRTETDRAITDVEFQANRIAKLGSLTSPLMETLAGFAIAAAVLLGGYDVIRNNGDPGAFFAFMTSLLMAYDPAKRLARLNVELEVQLVGIRMMYEVLDARPTMVDHAGARPFNAASAEIRFENVTFGYGNQPVLSDLNLTAPAGSIVALVGPSGAGKSTLLALIERFYDPIGGAITINGTNLKDFELASLRRHIALVTQDTFLFDGTIAENIADGRHEATMDEIIAAARDANAYGFIMDHPDGFNARVGGGGGNLSGGQRQRIAIARAVLRQAPILLLDEATSALDSQSEAEIQEALARLMQGRTTLVIAHRLATIREADIIYVMDRGSVRQAGSHEALIAEGGLYADLHALQFRPERAARA